MTWLFQTVRDRLTQMEVGAYQRMMLRLIIGRCAPTHRRPRQSCPTHPLSQDRERLGRKFLEQVTQELKKEV